MSADKAAGCLGDVSASGVYRAPGADALLAEARERGLDAVRISLDGVVAKPALLERIAEALRFPQWFGANWDALEDCLTDLSWRAAAGYLLIFENGGAARDLPPEDYGTLLDVLDSSAKNWATRDTPFFAVFIDPARGLDLPEIPPGRSE